MTPNAQNMIITLMSCLFKYPSSIGLTVEAVVPTAETMPIPNPETLEG